MLALRLKTASRDFLKREARRYEPRLRRQTRRLVHKHRDCIGRVALAVLERVTLQAQEIDALMSA